MVSRSDALFDRIRGWPYCLSGGHGLVNFTALSYLRKIIGTFYLGPYTKLSVLHRVKHIALLSRRSKHCYLHCISCKHLCVCDRGVNIKRRFDDDDDCASRFKRVIFISHRPQVDVHKGEGRSAHVNVCRQGEGSKTRLYCGRHKWMTPYTVIPNNPILHAADETFLYHASIGHIIFNPRLTITIPEYPFVTD